MALQFSALLRNARADAITSQIAAGGKLRIYTGSAPADCAAAASGTLLSEHTMGSPFAAAASGGVLTVTVPATVNAIASGTAGYWRFYKADGTTCVVQGSVNTTGGDLNLNTLVITAAGPVQINSWTITEAGA